MAEKAYKPIGTPKPSDANVIKKIIPPYEDEGIKFQGYSKRLLGNGDYILNIQERINFLQSTGAIAANNLNSYGFSYPIEGKIFYISSVVIDSSVGTLSTGSYFRILEKSSGNIRYSMKLLRSGNNQIVFNPPLKMSIPAIPGITPSGPSFNVYSGSAGTVNELTFNVYGWQE